MGIGRWPFAIVFIVLIGIVLDPGTVLQAQDTDDIFADVFGSDREEELVLPLFEQDEYIAEVRTRVTHQRVLVEGDSVTTAVSPRLNEDARSSLTALIGRNDFIDIGEFAPLGVFLVYQQEQARLHVRFSPEIVTERTIGSRISGAAPNIQQPVPVSGYVNLRGQSVVAHNDTSRIIRAEAEPVFNIRGWILESLVGFNDADDEPVTLRHSRIVRDITNVQTRAEAGIVRYDVGPLFGRPEVIGLSATRKEEIGFGPALFRVGSSRFVVPEEGTVEVYLNNRMYQTYHLPPGPHTITDIPVGQGINGITVTHTGSVTGEQRVLLSRRIYYSPHLVTTGRHYFSAAAGKVRDSSLPEALFASGLYQYGLGPHITVGGSTQLSPSEYALGLHSRFATAGGITRLDGAVYHSGSGNTGLAAEATHAISFLDSPAIPTLEVQGRYQSTGYLPVQGTQTGSAAFRAVALLNQRFGKTLHSSISLARTWALDDASRDETGFRISTTYRSPEGYTLSAQIGPTIDNSGTVEWQGSLYIRISTDDRRITTSTHYDIGNGPATVNVAKAPREPFGTLSWNGSVQGFDRRPGSMESLSGSLGYSGYLGSLQLQPRWRHTIGSQSDTVSVTARYATAFVWAGGKPAMSRPVRNGFVQFIPRDHIASYPIPVRSGGGPLMGVVQNGGAVLPDIPAWGTTVVTLDGSQLPDGYFPGTTPLSFRSAYRSGYRVVVGSEATVFVTGRLVNDTGEPVSLEAGEIVDSGGKQTVFFTDRTGSFEIIDVAPGEYRLFLYNHPEGQTIFSVPEGETGEYDLNDVLFLTREN